jgi:hypothetical protein
LIIIAAGILIIVLGRYSLYDGYPYTRKGGPRGFQQKKLQNLDSINYPLTKAEPTHGVSTN